MKRFIRILRGCRGQDNVEYALLAAFISIVALAAVLNIGPLIKPAYYMLQDATRRAATAHPPQAGSGDREGRAPLEE